MACFTYFLNMELDLFQNFLCALGKLKHYTGYVTIILILYYPFKYFSK